MTDPAPYFTGPQARSASAALAKRGKAVDGQIVRFVAEFEPIAERRLGVAFRVRTATHEGTVRRGVLELPHVQVVELVTLVNEDEAAVAATRVDKRRGRIVVPVAHGTVLTATYTHGLTEPTPGVEGACLDYVERRIATEASGTPRDVLVQGGENVGTRYSTPNRAAGRETGFLQVDALLDSEQDYLLTVF